MTASRKPDTPPPTFLCRNRAEITRALAEMRKALGVSQLALDELAGFPSGYTGKLEALGAPSAPNRRSSTRSAFPPFFDYWLEALGAQVVIVPGAEGAEAAARARRMPAKAFKLTRKTIRRIEALWETGRFNRPRLAEKFGAPLNVICDVTEGRGDLHLAPEKPKPKKRRRRGRR